MTREEIISEIQALAKRDGKVPGRVRFTAATGIKLGEWYGRYWARWGDALKDAGLIANELTAALAEEDMLGQYLDFVIELGRVPTEGEIRIRARTSPEFPGHSTFNKRFGAKHQLLDRLLAFAKEEAAPQDIIDAIAATLASLSPSREPSEDDVDGSINGYVYMLKSGRRYKIGKTTSPLKRLGQIGIELPERSEPIHTIETDDPSGIEAYWHNRFKDKRLNGEWFELSADDVRAFKRRRKFM